MSLSEPNDYPWYQLKYGIAEFLIPKLEEYKENFAEHGMCIPTWLTLDTKDIYSDDEVSELRAAWLAEIDKMIMSFRMVLNYNTGEEPALGYDEDTIQEGLDSFARHYQHLWD